MAEPWIDIGRLSVAKRLRLVERLWASLAADPESVPFTAAQPAELDRRLHELDRDGGAGISWEEVSARIRGREQ